jgi:Rhodopirellula transposase DDE domain
VESHEVIVNTTAATTSGSGLAVHAELDTADYPSGIKIPDRQINDLETTKRFVRHDFHSEWNDTLNPRDTPSDDTIQLRPGPNQVGRRGPRPTARST